VIHFVHSLAMIGLTLQKKMNSTASELCSTAENVLGYYTEYSPVINFIQYASQFHYFLGVIFYFCYATAQIEHSPPRY